MRHTPPSTDAIRRRGQPRASSTCGKVRGRSGVVASSSSSARMRALQRSWKAAISASSRSALWVACSTAGTPSTLPAARGALCDRDRHPGLELLEQLGELRGLLVGELGAQALVVADGDLAQALEQRLALVGQRDLLDSAVALLAPAPDQTLRLERVQVMRQR